MAPTLPLRSGSTLSVTFSSVMAPGSASSVAIWSGWLQVAAAGHIAVRRGGTHRCNGTEPLWGAGGSRSL